MNKTGQVVVISASLSAFLAVTIAQAGPQAKAKDRQPSGEESVSIVRDGSGAVTRLTRFLDMDGDLSPDPKQLIHLKMDIVEIRRSETKLISSPVVTVENGKTGEVIMGSQDRALRIEVVPTIKAGQGIELKVTYRREPEMKAPKEQTLLTPNSQTVLLELLENKAENSKLAVKITPLVEAQEGAKEYPDGLNELRFVRSFLIMNNDRLIAKGGLSVKNAEGGVVPYFFVEGKGAYILSFHPFEGAEPKGLVCGKVMRINFGEDEFEWFSEEPILPEGLWLLWVRNYPMLKPSAAEKGFLCLETKNGSAGILFGRDAWKTFFK